MARELRGVKVLRLEREGSRARAAHRLVGSARRRSSATWTSTSRRTCARLLPLVAPLLSGHSDLAIGTRLAARRAGGPRAQARAHLARRTTASSTPALRARFSDAQCGFKAVRTSVLRGARRRRPRRRLVLRHRAARPGPAPGPAHPRGPGRLDRRPRLARGHRPAPHWDDLRGVARLAADGAIARFLFVGVLSTIAYALLFLALRGDAGRRRREHRRARADGGGQHRRQPPLHLPGARHGGPGRPPRARRVRVRPHGGADDRRARGAARPGRHARALGGARRPHRGRASPRP